jgi:hypothetical protein
MTTEVPRETTTRGRSTMASRSLKYIVVGVLTMTYAVVVGLYWRWAFLSGETHLLGLATASKAVSTILFTTVPVMLLVTGAALCSWRADAPRRARVIALLGAVTAVLLTAKAVLAFQWACDHSHGCLGCFVLFLLVPLVVIPSGAFALLLAAMTALVIGEASGRQRRVAFGGLGFLLIATVAGCSAYLALTRPNMGGLEGSWRELSGGRSAGPYRFSPNGDVNSQELFGASRWHMATWERDGQRITIRSKSSREEFVGELGKGEIRGKTTFHDETGAVVRTVKTVWRRK